MTKATTLKYLFGVHFADGTELFQNDSDVSELSEGRNCYYDLLQHDEKGDVVPHPLDGIAMPRPDIEVFQLEGDGHRYVVSLLDGHFQVDDQPFYMNQTLPIGAKLRLVYFRRVRKHFSGRADGGRPRLISEEVEYHMGWETEDKSMRQVMVLV